MSVPTNILQNVITYQRAEIARLLNSFYAISMSNKKFKNFENMTGNLGDTVSFDRAPRYRTYNSLVWTAQPSAQLVQTLTCGSAVNTAAQYTDEQFIFNVERYMEVFGDSAVQELGSYIEADVLNNIISAMTPSDSNASTYGVVQYKSGPFRFFGNGVTQINTYQQLAQACANFRDFGAAKDKMEACLPDTVIPSIIGSGLNQFAINRNNKDALDWELGPFAECNWFTSNLLPIHVSGTIGNAAAPNNVMTVVSTNDATGANVTQITFTEPTNSTDANAIKAGDLFQFNDGVSGQPNMRFLTYVGHKQCRQPVQFRAIADAATTSGSVTVSLQTTNDVGLAWAANASQNLNNAIATGMTVTPMPSHQAGILHSGNQFYLAMPKLPDQGPFYSNTEQDAESGVSIQHAWGSQLGQNSRTYGRQALYGATMVSENCMRLLFPL